MDFKKGVPLNQASVVPFLPPGVYKSISMRCACLLAGLAILTGLQVKSQCAAPVAPPVVNCGGTSIPLVSNASINTGQVYYYSGTGATVENVNFGGGTLVICGTNLALAGVNFNSGIIIVQVGASVAIGPTLNTGGGSSLLRFYNYGSTTFNLGTNTLQVQGSDNFVYNAPGATFTANNPTSFNNQSMFVNEGTANGQSITINSGSTICMGANSTANVTAVVNNSLNSVLVPEGTACIRYSVSFTNNQTLTASPGLRICQESDAASPDGPATIGAALLTSDCSSCESVGTPVPLTLVSFTGTVLDGRVDLNWETVFEQDLRSFIIERSMDGLRYEPIGEVAANNRPSIYTYSTRILSKAFFRLKMVDADGSFTYSRILVLDPSTADPMFRLTTNPVTGSMATLSFHVAANRRGMLLLSDQTGRVVRRIPLFLQKGHSVLQVDIHELATGAYYLYVQGIDELPGVLRLLRVR